MYIYRDIQLYFKFVMVKSPPVYPDQDILEFFVDDVQREIVIDALNSGLGFLSLLIFTVTTENKLL